MSVLHRFGWGRGPRQLTVLLTVFLVALAWAGAAAVGAQVEGVEGTDAAADVSDLWSRVTEHYEVVVLSRGLLLEPLDEGVELLTIEVVDDQVAIDGEPMSEAELRDQIGEEAADIVLELAAMDRSARRDMFDRQAAEDVSMVAGVADEEDEARDWDQESEDERDRRRYSDSQVAVGNSLTIDEDEVAKEAVVFGGPLYIHGKVAGDAVAVGGSVTVSGEVTADVAAVGGDVTLEAGAEVLGDVVSVGGDVDIDDDAKVRGQIIEVPFGPNFRFGAWPRVIFGDSHDWRGGEEGFEVSPWGMATNFMWEVFKLILLALLACLIMLVARQPLERVKIRAGAEPWKSGLVGLLVQILTAPLLLLVILILVVSIIGIPLLLLVPFMILALILIAFLGYSGVALGVGDFLQRRFGWRLGSPYLVLLLGVLAIQIWSVTADLLDFGWGPIWFFAVMFGVFGVLVKYVAWTIGLGAAVLTRFGTADNWGGRPLEQLPPPPPEPSPVVSPPSEPRDPREPSVLRDPGFSDSDSRTSAPENDIGQPDSVDRPPSADES